MRIDVLTLFPEMFHGVLASSILKRAADPNLPVTDPHLTAPRVSYHLVNIRDYSTDKHHKVDNSPYGGGPGMVMQCQPVWDAVMAAEADDPRPAARVLMTPQGERLTQAIVEDLARRPRLLLIAGRYEGLDERVIEALEPIRQISIGDYVLSGGELPAMVLIDAVVRLIPGVLGHEDSAEFDSFSATEQGRLLDYPHYTRPPQWRGLTVPDVLLSGNHAQIEAWRRQRSIERTRQRRPDLMNPKPDTHSPP